MGSTSTSQQPPAGGAPLAPTRPVAFVRRLAGRLWLLVGVAAILEVKGRRKGTVYRVRLIPVKLDGKFYLLAFGGVTEWARNLRAAGGGTLHRRGSAQPFIGVEVEGDERDRVIAAYLRGSGPIRRDFNRSPDAAGHPTFRLDPRPD